MKPFLLLQTRPEDIAADNEYEAFMEFGGLDSSQLFRYRIHEGILPRLKLEDYSGIFLGGGPYCVTDPPDKKSPGQIKCEAAIRRVLDGVIAGDRPFLGACYIGSLIQLRGGMVSRKYSEVIRPYMMVKTAAGQRDKLLKGLPGSFIAYSGHKESCEQLPPGAINLVSSELCPYQMIRFSQNVYAVQFHPELDEAGLELRVNVYKNYGYFPPEAAESLVAGAKLQPAIHPVKILRNFVNVYRAAA